MRYPEFTPVSSTRQTVDTFYGLNTAGRIGDGELSEMENLTSDAFPLLSPRKKRGLYASVPDCGGLLTKDSLCYVDGREFVMNEFRVDMGLTPGRKTLVSMGSYAVIFPDKKYINTADLADRGSLENAYTGPDWAELTPCYADGTSAEHFSAGDTLPENPGNGHLWADTSVNPPVLRQWSEATEMWTECTEGYVKIAASGIGEGFRANDGVEIAGLTGDAAELNGSRVLVAAERDAVVIAGQLHFPILRQYGVTIRRTVPDMDYVIECGNRLWGCRCSSGCNEIYACALGDFRNWRCYQGTAADSYAVSVGSDGPFTGAVTHLGYPLFFKENCLHKIYGEYPANFRLQTTPCRGIRRGCSRSAAMVAEKLYYLSAEGVCAYDGSLPVEISACLGPIDCASAAGGAAGSKYYLAVGSGILVYDSRRGLWHREDDPGITEFVRVGERLYGLDGDGKIRILAGAENADESEVHWMARTGILGGSTPDAKYLTGLHVRLRLQPGSRAEFRLRYDSGEEWEQAGSITGSGTGSFCIPIHPRRCDHLQLEIRGTGEGAVFALTRTMTQGSDCF